METTEFRRTALQSLVQVGSENYKENVRILGVLDDKAQKVGAVAGAFLAAGFAFMKPENFAPNSPFNHLAGTFGLLLLAISIGLLLTCTVLALMVMWTRSVPKPLSFEVLQGITNDMINSPKASASVEAQENFLRDQAKVWELALKKQEVLNRSKAKYLEVGQSCLALAIILASVLLLEIVCKAIYYRLG